MDLISTRWSCGRCGAAYISTPPDTGICDDCIVVSLRQIFYGAATAALTTAQVGCLRGMLTDAIAYRTTKANGCAACSQAAEDRCLEHEADRDRVEAYRQLVSILTGGGPT